MDFSQAANVANKLGIRFKEIQNGYQFYIANKKVTVYKAKMQENLTGKWHPFKPGQEINLIAKIFDIPVNGGVNAVKDREQDAGVDACIKHVERKMQSYLNKNYGSMSCNEMCTMLKSLILEFEQYKNNPTPPVLHPNAPAVIGSLATMGTLMATKQSFLNQPIGTKALVYNAAEGVGVFVIAETGVELGFFAEEEIAACFEFISHTNLHYSYKSKMQVHQDFINNRFAPFFQEIVHD